MKIRKILNQLCIILFFCVFALIIPVKTQAFEKNCKVVFTNSAGEVTSALAKYSRTVSYNTSIVLPKVTKSGYLVRWVDKDGGSVVRYAPGSRITITKSVKFYLYYYKLCTVKFYSRSGGKEYANLSKQVTRGAKIKLPVVSGSDRWRVTGWSTKKEQKTAELSFNQVVTVKGDATLYLSAIPERQINLYWNDGTLYKQIVASKTEKVYFPWVVSRSGGNILGWSATKGQHIHPTYYSDGVIPTTYKNYYMVEYRRTDEKEVLPSQLISPTKYKHVYFIGDSRTERAKQYIEKYVNHVTYIGKTGQGLSWLRGDPDCIYSPGGYDLLLAEIRKDIRNGESGRKAVIFNLGANDTRNYNGYISFMNSISGYLTRNGCDLYFMSANPLNEADIMAFRGVTTTKYREKNIEKFNSYMKNGLNDRYTYININGSLKKNGWLSSQFGLDRNVDGLHYTQATYRKIYNAAIRFIENCY